MTSTGPFVAVLVALLVVGAIVHLLVLAYRYRKGTFDAKSGAVDDAYRDEHFDEGVYERLREADDLGPDSDPDEAETVPCRECQTVNEMTYTFCRNCTAKLGRA